MRFRVTWADMADLVAFRLAPGQDPDGSKLRAVLEAQRDWEAARARRATLVGVLALLSALVGYVEANRSGAGRLEPAAVAAWTVCAMAVVAAALAERNCSRLRRATARDMGPADALP